MGEGAAAIIAERISLGAPALATDSSGHHVVAQEIVRELAEAGFSISRTDDDAGSSRRATLPTKRLGESFEIQFAEHRLRVQISEFPDGRLGEIFMNASKPNSAVDNTCSDIAILMSLLIQHGLKPAAIGHALRRNPDGSPASFAGVIADVLAAVDAGEAVPGMVRS